MVLVPLKIQSATNLPQVMQRLPTVAAILVPILLLQAAPGNAQYFDDDANLCSVLEPALTEGAIIKSQSPCNIVKFK